ncbi:MAG TPA: AmmeMemoRadiSam system protein B [Terriglobales bacterium]|nr:AmmeMemoRadiSam system protein B [Terriglobales bacterium]
MEAVRQPAVAGRFYPGDRDILEEQVASYLPSGTDLLPALGCVAPHAGYIYSGPVAGAVYAHIEVPERCIVLCPNHTGRGQPLAIMSHGTWQTPFGPVPVDSVLADTLKSEFPLLSEDNEAHRSEHAIEVQLPFLQKRQRHLSFVPIAIGTGNFEALEKLGEALGEVVKAQEDRILIVASSDMNHYENDRITRVKDHKAIDQILAMNPRGLYDTITREEISMCGFGPTIAMLTAAKKLGAISAELIKYATSGEVSGDREMVVGYAGIVVG